MFKILFFVFCLMLLAMPCFSQTTYNQENAVIGWDASPQPQCICATPPCTPDATCPGTTYPHTSVGTVKYRVYKRADLVSAGTQTGSEITATQMTVHFTLGTKEYVGVEAAFYGAATPTVPKLSVTKAWSNNAADCAAAGPFAFLYQVPPTPSVPNKPSNMRISINEASDWTPSLVAWVEKQRRDAIMVSQTPMLEMLKKLRG